MRADNGVWQIAVKSEAAKDWLQNRLADQIKRSLTSIVGHAVELDFVVETMPAPASTTPAPAMQPEDYAELEHPVEPERLDFARIDYKTLYFSKTGYLPVAHYHTTFWQAFLGLFNTQAYNLWYTLQKFDKRNIFKSEPPHWWTPSKKISLRELTAMIGGSSTTLTGRLVPCWEYERSKEQGQPWAECCGKYAPTVWKPEGSDPAYRQCKHWKSGAIELLQRLRILLVEVKPAPSARSRTFRFQVWRMLPLLTLAQVEQLPLILQLRHEQWINEYGHYAGFDLDTWEQIEVNSDSGLVEQMPGHQKGQQLTNNYQPNPFLPACTTFMFSQNGQGG